MATQTPAQTAPTTKPLSRPATWLITLATATVVNLLIWLLTDPLAGHALVANQGGTEMTVTVPWVVAGSLVPGAIGLGIAAFLRRFGKGRMIWLVVSILALLLSLSSPIAGGTTTATVLVLSSMHVVAGIAVIAGGLALVRKSDVRNA